MQQTDFQSDLEQRYKQDQTSHYTARLEEFGSSAQADSWTSQEMAKFYYAKASSVFKDYILGKRFTESEKMKLLDIGSGNGFYAQYLQNENLLKSIDYTGIEINTASYEQAKAKVLEVSFLNGDFFQMNYPHKAFHFITIIGTFSIFKSLTVAETQEYILESLQKAFYSCEYGLSLLISRFVLEDESIEKFFNRVSKVSPNVVFDNSLFGNYLRIELYQNKHLVEYYNLHKSATW